MANLSTDTAHIITERLTDYYTIDEDVLIPKLIQMCALSEHDHQNIRQAAHKYVSQLRSDQTYKPLMDVFLQEYGLSTHEGLTLMRLAEALIRTPDFETGRRLMRDKLQDADWSNHAQKSDNFWVNQATLSLRLTQQWIEKTGGQDAAHLAARLGDRAMGLGVAKAMALMGEHFVLGRDIKEASKKSRSSHEAGFTHSYDMLGEAAYTEKDAQKYFQAYLSAIKYLAKTTQHGELISRTNGISVKLSALHPRYEYSQQADCVPVLTDRLVELAKIAKSKNLGLTIDAEEADRLEVSLTVFQKLLEHTDLANWDGLGIVIQSYQRRATRVIEHVIASAQRAKRKITVRLVKGAYWDMEIKRAQELGLKSYPVFTRKENTDISYLACARLLFAAPDIIYPQFATHNALTASTIIYMAPDKSEYEFQRLHGMGEALHQGLMSQLGMKCRIYAPVGSHKDLLPYLVRRLLENGANSSFVNQLFDSSISIDDIVESPFKLAAKSAQAAHDKIPAPLDIFGAHRKAAAGLDITQSDIAERLDGLLQDFKPYKAAGLISGRASRAAPVNVYSPANPKLGVGTYAPSNTQDIDRAIKSARASKWAADYSPKQRAYCLERAADLLESRIYEFLALCTLEAGKTYLDGIAELREAVDFCRYYAQQTQSPRISKRYALGTVACISPWNFPLAIFLGQIVAALSVGNTVIAKPAEQTPLMSHKAVKLLFEAGIPQDALHLIIGDGAKLGQYITGHSGIDGVCFTGSTTTAKKIAATLADTNRSLHPFIAETGGINAMIVDSTALLEQAVQDVIISAFQSTGQRCSACRLVCVQDDIADDFIAMLSGAMQALKLGNPDEIRADVGPVIDAQAHQKITDYIETMKARYKVLGETPRSGALPRNCYIAPIAFEIGSVADLKDEIFGPVLHITRFSASEFQSTVQSVNALGFGLTMGLHSRLDDRVDWTGRNAKVGNLYVNRNQIGALVGVQPFGGEGLSGTGPKAGGPHYLLRLSSPMPHKPASLDSGDNFSLVPPPQADSAKVTAYIKQAKTTSEMWASNVSAEDRLKPIKTAMESIFELDGAFWEGLQCQTHINFPGPTGESNAMTLHARGVVVCLGDKPALLKQAAMALYAGNSVIAISDSLPDELAALSGALMQETDIENLLQPMPMSALNDVLHGPIDAVAVDGSLRPSIGHVLCKRDGAILPVLSAQSDPERFFHERVMTNNITAAGGNATLLTLS